MNNDQPIEAEVVPTQAVAIVPEKQLAAPGLFGTTEPSAIITKAAEVATALKQVVVRQGLVSNIGGKQYPRCEAWTLLGTMLGVFPVLVWTKQVADGWEARVEARTKDGSVIGAAEAECLRTEKNWANRDDFALRSMAQTRATAKCLRMPLGFVMTLSGFEATPAEEMVSQDRTHSNQPATTAHQRPVGASGPHPATTPPLDATEVTPVKPEKLPPTPAQFLTKLIKNLEGEKLREKSTQFCIDLAWILPTESLEDLPFRFVPRTGEQYVAFLAKLTAWSVSGKADKPYEANPEPEPPKSPGTATTPTAAPTKSGSGDSATTESWYGAIVPVPHKGEKRDAYLKHPDTIGSLYEARHDNEEARKRLWGFLNNYEPKGWTKTDGTQMPPNKSDIEFRKQLDAFGAWFEHHHPEEKL